ncbi:MAG: aldo/keto reductase, partial [Bacteroidetes bacterium]|nr:aldo/keto reductase [Bacteroidota bacterium]
MSYEVDLYILHAMLRPLGNTSLSCYPLGFGSYRVNEGNPVHEAALRSYLDNGGNLVDTSSNYGDGLSEILVGRVVKDFVREKIIVVTKAGYMQGQNLSLAKTRAFPEVVEFGEGLWHCIHPEFLESQVEQSLRRMKLEVLDVFLLHNPEYFINYTARFDPIHEDVLDIF